MYCVEIYFALSANNAENLSFMPSGKIDECYNAKHVKACQ